MSLLDEKVGLSTGHTRTQQGRRRGGGGLFGDRTKALPTIVAMIRQQESKETDKSQSADNFLLSSGSEAGEDALWERNSWRW